MPLTQLQVGPVAASDYTNPVARAGKTGEAMVSELHGRFYEQNYRAAIYSEGLTKTAINNATYTTATLDATQTPIIGLYNPVTSIVNLVILQAMLSVTITAATKTGGGPYMWCSSVGNLNITATGNTPLNRKTLVAAGAYGKGYSNIAPTGLTNSVVARFASAMGGGSSGAYSQVDGTVAAPSNMLMGFVENFDGSLIVPPGGFLSLLATTTPVAHSAASGIVWEEVAI